MHNALWNFVCIEKPQNVQGMYILQENGTVYAGCLAASVTVLKGRKVTADEIVFFTLS